MISPTTSLIPRYVIISIILLMTVSCFPNNNRIISDRHLEQALKEELNITDQAITKFDLENIEEINLTVRDIENLGGLQFCTNLNSLGLVGNRIQSIEPLSSLTQLRELRLMDNRITDLRPLTNLPLLSELGLTYNNIQDLDPISSLTNLTILTLTENEIADIQPLENLINLQYLGLAYNEISDISPLVNNAGLGQGDEVSLSGNPLSDFSINVHIPALEARGIIVTY